MTTKTDLRIAAVEASEVFQDLVYRSNCGEQGLEQAIDEAEAILKAARAAVKVANSANAGGYRETNSPVYGKGRVYTDRPGATEYQGLTGRGTVQIWDN